MQQAIGAVLPLAVGIALSPVAIIAAVLMLVSDRARVNGPLFLVGWILGLTVIGVLVLVVVGPSASDGGQPAAWTGWLKIVLGALLLLIAARQWRARPGDGEEPPMPAWMGAVSSIPPGKALGIGALLSAVNPKNLVLALGAGTAIAQLGLPGADEAISYAVFVVVASLGVAVPLIIYLAMGDRAPAVLGRLKTWMGQHNAVIMAVLCLVIGVKLIGDGIAIV